MKNLHYGMIGIMVILLSIGTLSCSPASTPPGPTMAAGVYVEAGYEFFHWEEGLVVMLWHDATASSMCDSSGSTRDPVHSIDCQAISREGNAFKWNIETTDGVTGQFSIDDKLYDLSEGSLFIVRTKGGTAEIQQLQRDLSDVVPENDSSITEYGLNDPDIKLFIQSVLPEEISPTPTLWIDIEYPPDTRTGNPEIDRVIDVFLTSNLEDRVELAHLVQSPCTTVDGLGGPPKCNEGEADGTLVTVFPVLFTEGTHVRPDDLQRVFDFSVRGLFAVYTVPESAFQAEYWPIGEYAIVFTSEDGGHSHIITLHVFAGEIVRLESSMDWPPFEHVWSRSDTFILPPSTR